MPSVRRGRSTPASCALRRAGGTQVTVGDKAHIVELEDVEGVADGQRQDVSDLGNRQDAVVGGELLVHHPEEFLSWAEASLSQLAPQ